MRGIPEIQIIDLLTAEFEYDARGPERYDCWGLCMEMYRRFGLSLPDFASGIEAARIHEQINQEIRYRDFIKIEKVEVPSLATFRVIFPYVSHVGVMITQRNFIQIMEKGVSIGRIDFPPWKNRFAGMYRYNRSGT
jgi:cell wall-associated NlpC family hydrolase